MAFESVLFKSVDRALYLTKHTLFQSLKISYPAGMNYIYRGVLIPDADEYENEGDEKCLANARIGSPRGGLHNRKSAVCGLNGHRSYYIRSLFKVT
jgi:hypothetical protein